MKKHTFPLLACLAVMFAGCAGPQFHPLRVDPKKTVTVTSVAFEREIANNDWKSIVDVAADGGGSIYILDESIHQVIVCDAQGNPLKTIGDTGFWRKSFPRPSGIAADQRGNVYVSDEKKDNVQVFDHSGASSLTIGEKGSRTGSFRDPQGVDVDGDGNVYVVDQQNRRVQKFDRQGAYLMEISSGPKIVEDIDISRTRDPIKFIAWPSFNLLTDVSVGPQGTIYILDEGNCMVHGYSAEGAYLFSFGGRKSRHGKFIKPSGIAVGAAGVVCVSDEEKANVQLFDPVGRFLTSIGSEGDSRGNFEKPRGVDATGEARIYVADSGNRRVQVFSYSVPLPESVALLEKPVRIAIFDFKNNNPAARSRGYGELISDMFITAFAKSPNFEVVERKQLKKVLDELYFDQSGIVEAETAKKLGKVLGIDIALAGGVAVLGNAIEVDLRLLNVESGKVIIADSIKATHEGQLRPLVNQEAVNLGRSYAIRFGAPVPPRGLKVTGGVRSCTLTWSAGVEPDMKGYRIYRATTQKGPYDLVSETVKTQWSDSKLSDGATYYYRITAVDTSGKESTKCPPVEGATRARPAQARLRVKSKEGVKKLSFEWEENEDEVTGYLIYRSASPDGPFELVGESRSPSFSEGGFGDGERYHYKLSKKYRNDMESEPSEAFAVSTEAPPSVPKGLTARSGLARRVTLDWLSPEEGDVRTFRIYRGSSEDGEFELIDTVKRSFWSGMTYTDKGLGDHATFFYRVQAVDKYDLASPMSSPVGATTKQVPSTPLGLRATSGEARQVPLAWEKNPEEDIGVYVIHVAERGEGPFRQHAKTTAHSFLHEGCKDHTSYYYKIVAIDRDGLSSDFSDIASATTKPRPSTPGGLEAEGGLVKSVSLSWEKNPEKDIDRYTVSRRTGTGGEFRDVGSAQSNSYRETGLLDGTAYEYRIRAVDADGLVSDPSASVTITTKPCPVQPQGLQAAAAHDRIKLSWSPNPEQDVTGYEIFRQNPWDFLRGEKKIGQVSELSFEDCTAEPGKKYAYRITAFDETGLHSVKSKKVSAKIPQSVKKGWNPLAE